jgi:hypothetical protein
MEKSDFVFFTYDGNDYAAVIVRDITQDDIVQTIRDLQHAGYDAGGCVQLSREQTHYKDTNIIQPKKFLVWIGDGNEGEYKYLHDLPVFVTQKQAEAAIDKMEEDAEKGE